MVVLPADQTIEREEVFRDVLRAAAEHLATGAFGIDDPLVTLGVQPDRAATEYGYLIPDVDRGEDIDGLRAYPLARLRGEAEPGPGGAAPARDGDRLERRHLPVASPGDPRGARAVHGPAPVARPDGLVAARCSSAPTSRSRRPISIDYAVMEGAARDGQVVMARDGRRLVRPRLVVGAARGDRRRAGPGRSSRPARP